MNATLPAPTTPKPKTPTLFERTWQALGRGDLYEINPGHWVYAKWGQDTYTITETDDRFICTCPDAARHADDPHYTCKHAFGVLIHTGRARDYACGCGGVIVSRVEWLPAPKGRANRVYRLVWSCCLCGKTEGSR